MYGYEWTEEYGIFRLTIDAKIQKEIRPVFHEELGHHRTIRRHALRCLFRHLRHANSSIYIQ